MLVSTSDCAPPPREQRLEHLETGSYFVLPTFARKDVTRAAVRGAFLEEAGRLADASCRASLERDGLGKLHLHFPIDRLAELKFAVMRAVRPALLRMACAIGRQDLGLTGPFYVDDYTILRINYPFEQAAKASPQSQAPSTGHTLDMFTPPAPPIEAAANWVRRFPRRAAGKVRRTIAAWRDPESARSPYDIITYQRGLPPAAWTTGPHIDTWAGHSSNGINLWWAIEGVLPENLMVFYPELFGADLQPDPQNMYVQSGFALTRPLKFRVDDGDMLVFNPEIPHCTHVNVTESTRVAFTTRLNMYNPRFDPEIKRGLRETWHLSTDLERGVFDRLHAFPAATWIFEKPKKRPAARRADVATAIRVADVVTSTRATKVCTTDALPLDRKAQVTFDNATVLLVRTRAGLHALSARCPHLGIQLVDGFHDDGSLTCPGHGVTYDLRSGRSSCTQFKLRAYRAFEADGHVFVQDDG